MPIELSKPIAAYFAADRRDVEAVAGCFRDDAVVKDEGQTYAGLPAIKQWKSRTTAKYEYISAPIASRLQHGKTVVTSRLTGNFPGSPVDLRYFFEIDGRQDHVPRDPPLILITGVNAANRHPSRAGGASHATNSP